MGAGANIILDEEKALHHYSPEDNLPVFPSQKKRFDDEFDHSDWANNGDDDESSDGNESNDNSERTLFWESQESLLQEILEHYNSSGAKLRQEVSRLIKMARDTNSCGCPYPKSDGCPKCLRSKVVDLLCNRGLNASLCTSKWKNTHKFPGGKHEYIEVIASTQGRKNQIPFLIELGFQEEFTMAKACQNYLRLVEQLPEIYIGKADHLNAIVRVICNAAKRSATETKVHMGPWRTRRFMQMKWSASQERWSLGQSPNKLREISPSQEHIDSVRPGLHLTATAVKVA